MEAVKDVTLYIISLFVSIFVFVASGLVGSIIAVFLFAYMIYLTIKLFIKEGTDEK